MSIDKKVTLFKALGDPVRLKIIDFLLKKKSCECICHLAKHLKRDQSVVYRHIQILKKAGVLSTCKEAKFLFCCIQDKGRLRKLLG